MDFRKFLKLLYRRRIILIAIPVIAVVVTYFLVRKLPDQYSSRARIATGIVDQSQNFLNKTDEQESKISQEFSNLIQMIMLNKMLNQVSYSLIIHDLSKDTVPFKTPSKLLKTLDAKKRAEVLNVYKKHYQDKTELSLFDKDENGLYQILKSMGYDDGSLRKNLAVYRVNNSDFIDLEYSDTQPELAAYVVNKLCYEFITYYTSIVKENQMKAVTFYERLLREKQAIMNQAMLDLKNYKIKNHVLNLNEQAKSLYGQLADFETRRAIAEKDIIGYTAALKDIDSRFNPQDRKYLENALVKINSDIVGYKTQLNLLTDEYVTSNFDEAIAKRIDSVKRKLNEAIAQSSDKYLVSPLATKQDLITQKLGMEVTLQLAQNSVSSIGKEIDRLNKKFDGLVPHEAEVQAFENNIDVASREYLEILAKYNQTSLASNFSVNLRQIQEGMPGDVQPSKKMLLIILSGMISMVFCIIVLFILFYLDGSITEPKELVTKVEMTVLGELKQLKGSSVDIREIWQETAAKNVIAFRNALRAVRFEIDHEMGDANKILTITSLKPGEGKTFTAISLAYAYAMANKKILLIDGNFANPSITQIVNPGWFLEDILTGKQNLPEAALKDLQVLGNRGGDTSLMEVSDKQNITAKLQSLKTKFDVIIIEASALSELDKGKEWLQFTDKSVAVFEKGKTITDTKKVNVNYLTSTGSTFAGWILNKT